jgi:Uma2 family endonuclease
VGQTRKRPPAEARYRWEDFIALDEDDLRELVDGRLVEIEVPTGTHERIVAVLAGHLYAWGMARKAGIAFASGYKLKIRDDRGVMPDVQFFRRGGRPLPDLGLDADAPDLAVEVVSPSSRRYDRVTKLEWYASIAVPEYWIVDPDRRTVERLVLDPEGHYRLAETVEGDSTFAPASFEGLEIPLRELWGLPEWFGG